MSTDSIVKQKSMDFAKRIVQLYKYLGKEHHEYIMSKQSSAVEQASAQILQKQFMEAVGKILWQSSKLRKKKPQKHFSGLNC